MEHRIGPHVLRTEGDTVVIVLGKECLPDEGVALIAAIDAANGGTGILYLLVDVTALKTLSPEARRVAVGWRGISRIGGSVIIGATLVTRTLLLLISRASSIITRAKKINEIHFCQTEDEGRTWLSARRAALTAASSQSLRGPR